MNIIRILKANDTLFSAQYDNEELTELDIVFDRWNDVEYLREFFKANKSDLQVHSVNKAVEVILEDAEELEDHLLEIAEDPSQQLEQLFKPLRNEAYSLTEYQQSKAYGKVNRSWLRLYAVRVDANLYVITGGSIKLTRAMQERDHTMEELRKINSVRDYLKQHHFSKRNLELNETK